ncbi:MAG: nuclear transport factor 2 family protein [Hyphomicrobiaceae bacterium]
MATENSNVSVLRELYQDWHDTKGGCVERVIAAMDENVELSSLANGLQGAEFTKRCSCSAEVRGYFKGLLDDWSMDHYKVHDFIADGNRVVAVCHTAWTNKHTGKKVETPKVDIWCFESGKIISLAEYYDTAALVAAAT